MPGRRSPARVGGLPQTEAYRRVVRGDLALTVRPSASGDDRDVATMLLVDAVAWQGGERVVDLNAGAGLAGMAAAVRGAEQVWLAAQTIGDYAACAHALAVNRIAAASVHLSTGLSDLPLERGAADVALVRLPKGSQPIKQRIWDAWRVLRPGGHLMMAGGNDEGIRPALRLAEELFGAGVVLAYGKGHRVARFVCPAHHDALPVAFTDPLLDHQVFHEYTVTRRGLTLTVCGRPGVFGWERLDDGSAALIDTMVIGPTDQVLDLGCGTGIVGAVAARLAPRGAATLVDVAADALQSARRTLARNHIDNARVMPSDSVAALASAAFDVVVTNPPFHIGRTIDYDTAGRFVAGAATVLRPGGHFYLVANAFIPYEAVVAQAFGSVQVAWADRRYKILSARVPVGDARPARVRS